MRVTKTTGGMKVTAIAGTNVVGLGFDLPQAQCAGLRGFALHRLDHKTGKSGFIKGNKAFKGSKSKPDKFKRYSTRDEPIQGFQWADYSAEPGHKYTYTVSALKGPVDDLKVSAETKITVTTESPEGGDHDIYFNRGVAASQSYANNFGNKPPNKVANNAAWKWLSRGLYEALEAYVNTAKSGDELRISAYEFHFEKFLALLKTATSKGVKLQVVYDKRRDKPGVKNVKAIKAAKLEDFCTPRKSGKSYISHNKFIVKLVKGKPVSVWTGGTNFSEGGIYGHSNVGHLVEDAKVARAFNKYWELLQQDLDTPPMRIEVEKLTPLPNAAPAKGTTVIFSPRKNLDALKWYAGLANKAKDGLMMTFAFGMNKVWKGVYKKNNARFRLALMEKATRPLKKGSAIRKKEEQEIQDLRNMPENTFAIGSFIATNKYDGWVAEKLTSLNTNVRYVHNKFMLIDPLSNDPIVIAGSANFSDASTTNNDENMLVIRGNTRVADIYLGEFMRLYTHHAFRESLKWRKKPPKLLDSGEWWRDYFGNTERSIKRQFFAN